MTREYCDDCGCGTEREWACPRCIDLAIRRAQRAASIVPMARCPACGSSGDAAHIAACAGAALERAHSEGGRFVIGMVCLMLDRRRWVGLDDVGSLDRGLRAWTDHGDWRWREIIRKSTGKMTRKLAKRIGGWPWDFSEFAKRMRRVRGG